MAQNATTNPSSLFQFKLQKTHPFKTKKKEEEGEFRQNVIYQLLTFITSITGSTQPLIIVF